MSIIPSFFGRKANKALETVPLETWDPFEGIGFAMATPLAAHGVATTRMDWKETPEAHVFIAEVPGLRKDEVRVEVEEEKILKISGQRVKDVEDKNDKWHRVERSSEKFLRSVKLPPNARVEQMKATIENGVLTVTVPKGDNVEGGRVIQIAG